MVDVLARITQMRESHQWSVYDLAKCSGVFQSTISSWYRNKKLQTLVTLEAICNAYDMSIEQFMSPTMNMPDLTDKQKEWLALYDMMGAEEKKAICQLINMFTKNRRHRK